MFDISQRMPARDDELADLCADISEQLDRRLKAELGVAAREPLMVAVYVPDAASPGEVATTIADQLGRPVAVVEVDDVDDVEVLAFARPPLRVMQTDVLFLDPADVPAATTVLTAQGFTVENLDWADADDDGVVLSPAKQIRVRGWSDTGAFLDLMIGLVEPLGGDVSETSPADSPLDRSRMN